MPKPFAGQNPRNLTPVRDPRTRKLLGYRDRSGRTFTPDGKQAPLPSGGYGGYLAGTDQKQQDAADLFRNVETPAQQQQRKETADSKDRAATASTTLKKAWVDGQYVTIQPNPDGSWTITGEGKDPKKDGSPISPPSAFSALDGQSIPEDAPFLMGYTTGGGPAGQQWNPSMSLQLRRPSQNMLTVGGGVAWLAELSTRDPGAYQAMLDKLHAANYLSDKDYASAAGHWSSAAGQAFALAARDVAVVNTTAVGKDTTLDQFLTSKQGALAAANAGGAYTPIERKYTDPEDLKANAKSEAEQTLGRQLTDAEEAELVQHFRGLEDAAYDQVDAAQGKSFRVTTPGMGQVDAYVEGPQHEQEAANYRAAGYGLMLKQLFGLG